MHKLKMRHARTEKNIFSQRADFFVNLEGTYRACEPEHTWEKLCGLLEPAGITRVADVTGLDTIGTPTYMIVRPLSRSLSVSQGKGVTPLLAKISGVMESMEAFHSENFIPQPITLTLDEISNDNRFMHITDLPLRPELNCQAISRIHWIKADTLLGNKEYVPRELVDLDFTLSNPWRQHIFAPSSNGLAAGNTEDEALVHALCEICERDQIAFALVKKEFNLDGRSTRLDLSSIDDDLINELLDDCQKAGLEVAVWDCRSEINIPCFICSIFDAVGNSFYALRSSGSGCHPDKKVALLRAITEAFQSRLTNISGSRDDKFWQHYHEDLNMQHDSSQRWVDCLTAETPSFKWGDIENGFIKRHIDSMADMVIYILNQLKKSGIRQVAKVNLTTAPFNIPVVKVIAAKMEQNIKTPGYSPGPRMQALMLPLQHKGDKNV